MCLAPLQAPAKAPVAKSSRVRGVGLEEANARMMGSDDVQSPKGHRVGLGMYSV